MQAGLAFDMLLPSDWNYSRLEGAAYPMCAEHHFFRAANGKAVLGHGPLRQYGYDCAAGNGCHCRFEIGKANVASKARAHLQMEPRITQRPRPTNA